MKTLFILLCFTGYVVIGNAQSIGIGTTTPHSSALLDVQSTAKGMLVPRLTQAEVNAIPTPAQGLIVFNTSTNSFQFYNGSGWNNITHSGLVTGVNNRVPRFSGAWGLNAGMMTDNGAGVSINTGGIPPNTSAILDIASNTKGILVPRMTSTERTAITTPANGLLVYDNTTNTFWFYNGTVWTELAAGGGGSSNWNVAGNNIYNANTENVGIGTAAPDAKLTVTGDATISAGLGIATTTPDLISYKFDVNGSARTRIDQYVNRDLWVDRNLDVDGTSNLFGNITAGGNLAVSNMITMDGGKGLVRSTNGTQQVVAYTSGSIGYTNAPAGYTEDVQFAFSNVFSATPHISMAQVANMTGNFGSWVLTIHSVDLATRRFWIRFYNSSPSPSTFTATYTFILVGPAL